MQHRANKTAKLVFITLLFALLHQLAGLTILVISSWFIALCAIAPVAFNYVIPAVLIRALALLRITCGYAFNWFGHHNLLSNIARQRVNLFKQLHNQSLRSKAWTVEGLTKHTEQLASKWIAWVAPLSSVNLLLVGVAMLATVMALPGSVFLSAISACCWGLLVLLFIAAKSQTKQQTKAELIFRQQSEVFLSSSQIWHLKAQQQDRFINAPTGQNVWQADLRQIKLTLFSHWALQGMAYALVILCLLTSTEAFFTPLGVVVPMLLLAAPEWAGGGFAAISKLTAWRDSQRTLQQLDTQPYRLLPRQRPQYRFSLDDFVVSQRMEKAQQLSTPATALVLLEGESGSGKSSLLQAIAGLIPSQGQRWVDNQALPRGLVQGWLYVEQTPIILSASIRLNMNPAGQDISDDHLLACLQRVGLSELQNLETWLGDTGRALSGGERKRLALARAMAAKPDVLLVDEPFEGLDANQQQQIAKVLNTLAQSTLIFVASHLQPDNLSVDARCLLTTHPHR